ncbi:MAG: hypothetical protein IKE70_02535 [Bacilli bacterium]|nr:hypothetical protein [Bacilli bacterium]
MNNEEETAMHIRTCPTGYQLVNRDRCIGTKEIEKEDGFICIGENKKLKGNECIIYEKVEAKQNEKYLKK